MTRRRQSQEEFNYDRVELVNVSAATSAFARFDHAFWLRVCVVGRIGWTLMGGARSSSFIHLLALQLFAIGFALFGRPVLVRFRRWRHLFRWSILLCRSILLCHWSAGFRIRLHVLRPGCPHPAATLPPSWIIVVDFSETSPLEGQDLWAASTLLYGCIKDNIGHRDRSK